MRIKFCPKCKGTTIVAVAGAQIGLFKCADCKFRSPMFPEKEIDEKELGEKKWAQKKN